MIYDDLVSTLSDLRARRKRQRLAPCGSSRQSRNVSTQISQIRRRLGAEIARARTLMGYRSQAHFGRTAGLGRRTIWSLEAGEKVTAKTYVQAELVLGWPTGTCQNYIDGRITELPTADHKDRVLTLEQIESMSLREIAEAAAEEEEKNGPEAGEAFLDRALSIKANGKKLDTRLSDRRTAG